MLKRNWLSELSIKLSGDRTVFSLVIKQTLTKGLLLVLAGSSWLGAIAPVRSQALLPYALPIDSQSLEEQGLKLTQDAAQLLALERYDLAFPRAKLATQLAPNLFQTWFILGTIYSQREEYQEAIAALEKARVLAPEEAAILFTLGSTYFREENYRAAVRYLEEGLKKQPDTPQALFDLGNAYLKIERYPKAIESYQKAIDIEAAFWPAINNVGLIKYEQGDIDSAIDRWQAALKIDKEQAEPELALAVAFFIKGDRQKGIRLGRTALRRDPRYANLEFLRENLWGDRLIRDTQTFMATPQIRALTPGQ